MQNKTNKQTEKLNEPFQFKMTEHDRVTVLLITLEKQQKNITTQQDVFWKVS